MVPDVPRIRDNLVSKLTQPQVDMLNDALNNPVISVSGQAVRTARKLAKLGLLTTGASRWKKLGTTGFVTLEIDYTLTPQN